MEEAYRKAQAHLVEDAMTTKVLAFTEDSFVSDIARAMIEYAVNRVPIVRGSKVVGIVSRMDVIRALAKEATGDDPCEFDNYNNMETSRQIEL